MLLKGHGVEGIQDVKGAINLRSLVRSEGSQPSCSSASCLPWVIIPLRT